MTNYTFPEIDDSQQGLLRRFFENLQSTKDKVGAEQFYRDPQFVFYTFLLHHHLGSPDEVLKDALAFAVEQHKNAIGEAAFAAEWISEFSIDEIMARYNEMQ